MNVIIITKDNKMTEFMQYFDVFEKSKVILGPSVIIKTTDEETSKDIIDLMLKAKGKDSNIIALFDETGYGFIDKNVTCVSTGYSWSTFPDMLKKLGYK